MFTVDNDIAAPFSFRIVRGLPFSQYFDLLEDGQPMDVTGAVVKQDVRNWRGEKVTGFYSVGEDGYRLYPPNRLVLVKGADEKNIPVGQYTTSIVVAIPGRPPFELYKGLYVSVNNATK